MRAHVTFIFLLLSGHPAPPRFPAQPEFCAMHRSAPRSSVLSRSWLHVALIAALVSAPALVSAQSRVSSDDVQELEDTPPLNQNKPEPKASPKKTSGFGYQGDLSFRIIPLGLSLTSHAGYRHKLFNSDSVLFKDAYVEAGLRSIVSPAMAFTGGYVKAAPIALLDLKLSATYNYYLGTFGMLYVSKDQDDPEWSLDDISANDAAGLGQSGTGYMIEAQVTPKVRIGDIVAFCPLTWSYVNTNVDGAYYEPWYDHLLAPEDTFFVAQPTLGMIPYTGDDGSFLMTAFRWEHATSAETDVTRDMPSFLLLWGLPKSWIATGNPRLAVLTGYWVRHPENREGDLYLGTNFSMKFGAY